MRATAKAMARTTAQVRIVGDIRRGWRGWPCAGRRGAEPVFGPAWGARPALMAETRDGDEGERPVSFGHQGHGAGRLGLVRDPGRVRAGAGRTRQPQDQAAGHGRARSAVAGLARPCGSSRSSGCPGLRSSHPIRWSSGRSRMALSSGARGQLRQTRPFGAESRSSIRRSHSSSSRPYIITGVLASCAAEAGRPRGVWSAPQFHDTICGYCARGVRMAYVHSVTGPPRGTSRECRTYGWRLPARRLIREPCAPLGGRAD